MNAKTILLVDDQKNTRKVLSAILKDEGYEVVPAAGGSEALRAFKQRDHVDLVLSDLKMPAMDGIELYRRMGEIREPPPFIIMTAYGTVKSAVQAMRDGVSNYLIKPLDFEELLIVVNKAIREFEMSRQLSSLQRSLREENAFHGILGASQAMQDIFEMVRTVGDTDASVMIYGETGTGKELLARALHAESVRRDHNLVCINSAALTESLLEAELFGYVKGAFTGANAEKKGRLEIADGGTLFLDEIGHMSLRLQSKLLRFLQERKLEPVGGVESRQVDVRILAATNLDLQDMIESGQFLRDLFYRLEVISIQVPPLRERRDDIPLLADHYLQHYVRQYGKPLEGIASEAMAPMMAYSWPGNVRELKNCMARGVILSKGRRLTLEDLPELIRAGDGETSNGPRGKALLQSLPRGGVTLRTLEVELIQKTLEQCQGNKSLTARRLGISRKALYEKLNRYGIPAN